MLVVRLGALGRNDPEASVQVELCLPGPRDLVAPREGEHQQLNGERHHRLRPGREPDVEIAGRARLSAVQRDVPDQLQASIIQQPVARDEGQGTREPYDRIGVDQFLLNTVGQDAVKEPADRGRAGGREAPLGHE